MDEIWVIPTGCSYMKRNVEILPGEERLKMASLAVKSRPWMKCLDIEIKRSGYTYSYETLEQLKKENPDFEFYFIFGADCLFTIENWKYPERIFNCCRIIAAVRNDSSIAEMQDKKRMLEQQYSAKISLLPFIRLEISSTDLRERISIGKSVTDLIPEPVVSYIVEKGFYTNL